MEKEYILDSAVKTLERLNSERKTLYDRGVVLGSDISRLKERISDIDTKATDSRASIERLTMAAKALQSIIDGTSSSNLRRVVEIVNMALDSVFNGQGIVFDIVSSVKRGVPVYELKLSQNGVEGSLNSFGGGVLSVVSVVLKVMLNVMAKRSPIICLDETLSGLSEEYIPAMSALLRDICNRFGIYLILVTHQRKFLSCCDYAFKVRSQGDNKSVFDEISRMVIEES